jgi:hypothetical protein
MGALTQNTLPAQYDEPYIVRLYVPKAHTVVVITYGSPVRGQARVEWYQHDQKQVWEHADRAVATDQFLTLCGEVLPY